MTPQRRLRVAVTGGSGRVGRHVLAELAADHDVTVLDRVPCSGEYTFRETDILQPDSLAQGVSGHDAIIHLAGLDLDRDADPGAYLTTNVIGTWNVLAAARAAGVSRVITCSSVTASGFPEGRSDWQPRYLPIDEDHPDAPAHPYGLSKLLAEEVARSFTRDSSMAVINLRAMWIPLPETLSFAIERSMEPGARWTFAHVAPEDFARAVRCALRADHVLRDTFYITAPDSCHGRPTLDWLHQTGEAPIALKDANRFKNDPYASLFDGRHAREALGFVARLRWPDILQQAGLPNPRGNDAGTHEHR